MYWFGYFEFVVLSMCWEGESACCFECVDICNDFRVVYCVVSFVGGTFIDFRGVMYWVWWYFCWFQDSVECLLFCVMIMWWFQDGRGEGLLPSSLTCTPTASSLASASVWETPIRLRKAMYFMEWQAAHTFLYTCRRGKNNVTKQTNTSTPNYCVFSGIPLTSNDSSKINRW